MIYYINMKMKISPIYTWYNYNHDSPSCSKLLQVRNHSLVTQSSHIWYRADKISNLIILGGHGWLWTYLSLSWLAIAENIKYTPFTVWSIMSLSFAQPFKLKCYGCKFFRYSYEIYLCVCVLAYLGGVFIRMAWCLKAQTGGQSCVGETDR